MSYSIMQMPISIWHSKNVIFSSDSKVSFTDYCIVYQDDLPVQFEDNPELPDLELCNQLFQTFNINHPKHFGNRSLSAGDIVMIERNNVRNYYLCCMIGWHKLKNF